MTTPTFKEDHVSQIPALQLLINLGYEYLSPKEAMHLRQGKSSQIILEPILRKQLEAFNQIDYKGKVHRFSEKNIASAIRIIKDLPLHEGFIAANQELYNLLVLGTSLEQEIEGDKKGRPLSYIDWKNVDNNAFHVTEEFSTLRTGRNDSYRPDLVLFVNGIPLVVIECKSPALQHTQSPIELATEQHLRNSKSDGIRSLYVYSQLLISLATNSASYGTTGTDKEYWSIWKELFHSREEENTYNSTLDKLKNKPLPDSTKALLFSDRFYYVKHYFDKLDKEERSISEQDKHLYSLCQPKRLLDLIHNFTLYDKGIKKIARYQQYFTVNQTMQRVAHIGSNGKRQGGVIWHTQGSGKSLTMVMLAQMIAAESSIKNQKIVLVTDRINLDKQIKSTFEKCQKEVEQATTGSVLSDLLKGNGDKVITAVINKFEAVVKKGERFDSPNIFVLIDEGHRTQYGSFHVNMERIFPNACFIAFTGTPLMKTEKNTAEKFGGYIGQAYTVKNAVDDGAVVPLLYEGRHNIMTLNQGPLDVYFNKLSEPLSDYGKVQLKKRFNTVNELNKADQVIFARAMNISEHYTQFHQTYNDKYKPKAQLVAPSIKAALKYKEYLDQFGQVSSEVIVTRSDQREGTEDAYYNENEDKEREDRYFNSMIDKYGDLDKFEENVINQFKYDQHPEILIVVAKLLTGFDAPCNTILYVCRSLKEHTLLQAVARVNRVYPGKNYGYIIDYYGNLEHLDQALETYSSLKNFEAKDLSQTFKHVGEEIAKLPQAHAELWDIFKSLNKRSAEVTDYEEVLRPEDVRYAFYNKLSSYARLLKLALSSVHFVENTADSKIDTYKKDSHFFLQLRIDVKRRFNDHMDYKKYEPQIQKLINQHLSTTGQVLQITELVDVFNKQKRDEELGKIRGTAAQADHIATRTKKAINILMDEDPVYYKRLAELIQETIDNYLQKRIDEAAYLKRVKELENQAFNGRKDNVPEQLKNQDRGIAFYNWALKVFENEALKDTDFYVEAAQLTDQILSSETSVNGEVRIDWSNNEDIIGKITISCGDGVYDLLNKYSGFHSWDQIDLFVTECIKVAKSRR